MRTRVIETGFPYHFQESRTHVLPCPSTWSVSDPSGPIHSPPLPLPFWFLPRICSKSIYIHVHIRKVTCGILFSNLYSHSEHSKLDLQPNDAQFQLDSVVHFSNLVIPWFLFLFFLTDTQRSPFRVNTNTLRIACDGTEDT